MAILPARNFPQNCGTAATGPTLPFSKREISQESFGLSLSKQQRFTGAATSPTATTIDDRVVTRSTSAAYVEDVVAVATRRNGFFGTIAFSSATPAIVTGTATNDGQYQFTHVANGTAEILAQSSLGLRNRAKITISSGSSTSSDVWSSWAAGSLGHHIAGAVVSRASVSGVSIDPWLIKDHLQQVYTRRPTHWLYDVDLSCVSVWNSSGGQLHGGTLVTPEHAVFADHFRIPVGATVRFVTASASNAGKLTVEDRTVAASERIPWDVTGGDIQVVRLSAAVSVPFCKVVPTDVMDYLPSVTRTKANNGLAASRPRLPIVATNQDKHFGYLPCFELKGDWITTQGISGQAGYGAFEANQAAAAAYPTLVPFVRSGCSGHPLFLLVGGELVLVGLYFSASAGNSFQRQATHDAVNAALATLGGGYQLTPADLSAYTQY